MSPTSATPVQDHDLWLPQQVWSEIFQHLDVPQLKQVRLTCSYWKTIVDGDPTLMDKVLLKLSTTMDQFFRPARLVPARSALLIGSTIVTVDLWWPQVGALLQDLELYWCRMSVTMLLGMLRKAPRLKRLMLHNVHFSTGFVESDDDYRLEKLEELVIDKPDRSGITLDLLPIFGPACPRLKIFSHENPRRHDEDAPRIVDFLEQVRGTIEELKLVDSEFLMDAITAMDGMDRLQRVTFRGGRLVINNGHLIQEFCRKHSNLEELNICSAYISHETACRTIEILPYLKRATVLLTREYENPEGEPLRCHSYSLECLSIQARHGSTMNLVGYKCPNVRDLRLTGIRIEIGNLVPFLAKTKQLRTLSLNKVTFPEGNAVAVILRRLPSLQKLSLEETSFSTWNDSDETFVHSLKILKVKKLRISQDRILAIADVFPHLEQLHLQESLADDEVILRLCKQLPTLRNLSIVDCSISNDSMTYIDRHCRNLKRLELTDNMYLGGGAVNRLKSIRPESKVVFNPPMTAGFLLMIWIVLIFHLLVCAPLRIANILLPRIGMRPWRASFLNFPYRDRFWCNNGRSKRMFIN